MGNHSKGTWTVERPQMAGNDIVEVPIYARNGKGKVTWGVCVIRSTAKGESKIHRANALLISAAPDMLDAINLYLQAIQVRSTTLNPGSAALGLRDAEEMMRRAIDKANGITEITHGEDE